MRTTFLDMNYDANPLNGSVLQSAEDVDRILPKLYDKGDFVFKLESDDGSTLDVGLSEEVGFVQHTPSDSMPPYKMARLSNSPAPGQRDTKFIVCGTATPIDNRYCLPKFIAIDIAKTYVQSGELSSSVVWEEI